MNIKTVHSQLEKDHALHVRNLVFIQEQQVPPEAEVDEHEQNAIHFVGYNERGEPIAASRLRWTGQYGKLERICVLKQFRNRSYGKQLIAKMETVIKDNGYTKAMLHSQTHAKQFYERLGYKVVSNEFSDAGIPHVKMVKTLQSSPF